MPQPGQDGTRNGADLIAPARPGRGPPRHETFPPPAPTSRGRAPMRCQGILGMTVCQTARTCRLKDNGASFTLLLARQRHTGTCPRLLRLFHAQVAYAVQPGRLHRRTLLITK